jgi:SAM-dependent methyltransferase
MTRSDIKTSVHEQFSLAAASYAASEIHANGVDLPVMLQQANLIGDELVLDAGTGAGHAAILFAPHVQQIIAIDLSTQMLEQGQISAAKRKIPNVSFVLGDVEQLQYEDETFDLVVSRYSAHHRPNPQKGINEIHRVLKPEGRLLLGDIVSIEDFAVDTFLQTIEMLRDKSHVRDHTVAQWRSMLHAAGFTAEYVHSWGAEIEFQSWIERMQTPADMVTVLKQLLENASAEVQQALLIQPDHSFTMPGALIRGTK